MKIMNDYLSRYYTLNGKSVSEDYAKTFKNIANDEDSD
jgi:hypothetical protein